MKNIKSYSMTTLIKLIGLMTFSLAIFPQSGYAQSMMKDKPVNRTMMQKENVMQVTSSAIVNGKFNDKYGKRGTQFTVNGMPSYSIPFEIKNAPKNTKSFAVVFEDKDAAEVAGFVWTHWIIADLERTSVAENESISAKDFVQGANSWASKLNNLSIAEASGYGGMAPPNKPHRYELYVYALDKKLNLKPGFRFNELHFAMKDHILAQAYLVGVYDSE